MENSAGSASPAYEIGLKPRLLRQKSIPAPLLAKVLGPERDGLQWLPALGVGRVAIR